MIWCAVFTLSYLTCSSNLDVSIATNPSVWIEATGRRQSSPRSPSELDRAESPFGSSTCLQNTAQTISMFDSFRRDPSVRSYCIIYLPISWVLVLECTIQSTSCCVLELRGCHSCSLSSSFSQECMSRSSEILYVHSLSCLWTDNWFA